MVCDPRTAKPQKTLTLLIGLILVDDAVCISQRGPFSLLLHQELYQVVSAHEARGFSVLLVDHVNLHPLAQQIVQLFDLLPRQVSRLRFVAILDYGGEEFKQEKKMLKINYKPPVFWESRIFTSDLQQDKRGIPTAKILQANEKQLQY